MRPDNTFSSEIGPFANSYLAIKEALGRRYKIERRTLTQLDRFLSAQPPERSQLSVETFAFWTATFQHLTPTVRRNRMRIVRNLCLYRRRGEQTCFVPDLSTFPKPRPPRPAHIFTEQQIIRILEAADQLQDAPTSPLYRQGMRLAIVLLYTSGLRRGEVVRLTLGDYDQDQRTLRIRDTKFHKSRVVPLSSQAASEIVDYLKARRQLPNNGEIAPLLCNCHGGLRPYTGAGLAQGIRRLFVQAQVRTAGGRLPRIHDLRHTFAVHALHRWYKAGTDVQAKLPALSTYMGHVSIVSTQHYLAVLDLFGGKADDRFARHCTAIVGSNAAAGGAS